MKISREQIDSVLIPAQQVEVLFKQNGKRSEDENSLLNATHNQLKQKLASLPDEQQLELEALYWFGKEDRFGARGLRFFDQALGFAQFERQRRLRPKAQGNFLVNEFADLSSAVRHGLEKHDQELTRSKLSETSYSDSKIHQALYELVVGSGSLRERVANATTGLAFLQSDKTGRFSTEAEDIERCLRSVKKGDFTKVTDNELREVAEATLSAFSKLVHEREDL